MLRTIGSISLVCAVGAWVVSTKLFAAPDAESTGGASAVVASARQDVVSTDRLRKLTALRVLAAAADRSVRMTVENLCRDADPAVALEASHALSRITTDPGPLVAAVERCGEDAVHALGDGEGPQFDATLQKLARSHDPAIAAAALRTLAKRDPAGATKIVRVALVSVTPAIRVQALFAAVRAPDASYAEALADLARSEDATERTLAIGALAHAGDADAAAKLLADADRGEAWDRLFAAETAGWAQLSGAEGAWRRAVASLRPADRVAALSRFRGELPEALRPALRDYLADGDARLRLAAAVTLAFVGDEQGLAALRRGVESTDRSLVADAQVALAASAARAAPAAVPDDRSGKTDGVSGNLRAQ